MPWSLMMNRSTPWSLLEAGTVRPAQEIRLERSPCTGISAVTMPLGPSAAQAMSASSTSLSGTGWFADSKASGPSRCFTTMWEDQAKFSSSPVSLR